MSITNIGRALDISDYLRKTSFRDYLLFSICLETGMKLDQVLSLKVFHLRNKKAITVSGINIKLRKEVMDDINAYCKTMEKNEFIFQSNQGINQKLCKRRAIEILTEAAGMFGIENFYSDTLRKSFGYFFYIKTRDLKKLKRIYGQSKDYDTLKYIGLKGVVDENR